MEQFDWDWFVTLTFRGAIGEWGAERKFRRLVRKIRQDVGHRIEWFRVTEWHKFRAVPHYHALFANCQGLKRLKYVDWWWGQGYGIARIMQFERQRGAGYYLSKYLLKQSGDLAVSRGLYRFVTGVTDDPKGLSLMSPPGHKSNRDSTVTVILK